MDGGNNVFILRNRMIFLEDVLTADQVREVPAPETEVSEETLKKIYFGREREVEKTESVIIGRSTDADQGKMVKLFGDDPGPGKRGSPARSYPIFPGD
jgi:hypothetical protein